MLKQGQVQRHALLTGGHHALRGNSLATYGFKLLRVESFIGRGHKRQDFGQIGLLDAIEKDIAAAVERSSAGREEGSGPQQSPTEQDLELAGESEVDLAALSVDDVVSGEDEPLEGSDDVIAGDESGTLLKKKPDAVVQLEGSTRYRNALLMRIQYGIVGDHEYGVDPTGQSEAVDLKKRATTRHYRAVLITPDKGETGFLAVEAVSRSNPGSELPRRLHQARVDHNYKLRSSGTVADEPSVKALMRDGHVDYVELVKSATPEDGAYPVPFDTVLRFKLGGKSSYGDDILGHVRGWVSNWMDKKDEKESINAADEARDLASILWKGTEDLGFDTARVKVKSSKQAKTLQPLDVKEGFVYDLGSKRLDDDAFFREVALVAQSVFSNNEMDMPFGWNAPVE